MSTNSTLIRYIQIDRTIAKSNKTLKKLSLEFDRKVLKKSRNGKGEELLELISSGQLTKKEIRRRIMSLSEYIAANPIDETAQIQLKEYIIGLRFAK